MYKGKVNHLIDVGEWVFLSYENILKNSFRRDPWHSFIIKKFTEDGTPLLDYISVSEDIFLKDEVKPYTKQFNPEILI